MYIMLTDVIIYPSYRCFVGWSFVNVCVAFYTQHVCTEVNKTYFCKLKAVYRELRVAPQSRQILDVPQRQNDEYNKPTYKNHEEINYLYSCCTVHIHCQCANYMEFLRLDCGGHFIYKDEGRLDGCCIVWCSCHHRQECKENRQLQLHTAYEARWFR